MTKSITEISAEIVEEFSYFDDWMDKYQYIIEMGQNLKPLETSFKTDDHIVRGCQSQVWLEAHENEDRVEFGADSDAIITKGLVGLLTRVFSGQKPADILNADMGFMDEIGIREHLSPTRSNGLSAMVEKIRMYALGFQHKMEQQ